MSASSFDGVVRGCSTSIRKWVTGEWVIYVRNFLCGTKIFFDIDIMNEIIYEVKF